MHSLDSCEVVSFDKKKYLLFNQILHTCMLTLTSRSLQYVGSKLTSHNLCCLLSRLFMFSLANNIDLDQTAPKKFASHIIDHIQGTKIFQYCTNVTCPAGRVTYNFHLSCKHMHLSFKSVCIKEHKEVICNTGMT